MRKYLDLINTYRKVTGHRSNIKTLIAFLYTNNKQTEKKIRKTIPFRVA
jgi:hypothetical protein